ncbi:MAG: hypothetical protein LBP82_00245 [Candidatus Methanoplasma sp.]|jgi:hypothetical protein|nr:hypothetical protein [Candidatus Methanoplasma sp.]
MMIETIRSVIIRNNNETVDAELEEDVLSINCRKCSRVPDFKSPLCLKCIIQNISKQGSAGRIRLRTSRDLEIFGPAAEALCEMAVFYNSAALNTSNGGRACSDCANSCSKVMEIIWAGFPDPNFDSARGRLMSFRPSDNRCNTCMQKTYRALDQAELGVSNLKKKVSIEAARTGGV